MIFSVSLLRYISKFFFQNIIFYFKEMKGEFEARPTSKNVNTPVRPTSRYVKPELALQAFTKGKEYQKQSSFQKAIEQYLKTLMYNPNYFQAYCNMGSCYRAQGKYLEARSMYLKAINIKSDDAISHYNLANTLRIIGNYEDSIKHYQFVIKLGENPSANLGQLYKNSLVNLGICYKQVRAYQASIVCFEKARKIDVKDESTIYNEAMTYMAMLETINTDLFYELAIQKAEKAEALFKNILKMNPNHQMASLKLNRLSTISDRSNKNLKIVVNKLKDMLLNQNSHLKKEINEELGYVLNLLKQYQKSALHYQQSVINPHKKAVNIYDTDKGFVNNKLSINTQEQALALVNQDRLDEVNQLLQKMDDNNISKHVIESAIQLHLFQLHPKNQQYLEQAIQTYNKYFIIDNRQIGDQKLSIQAHKLLGKVLSLQGKFKESIRHFQYITSQLKSNNQISRVRSSLGNDYQALGDKEKALEQYQLALTSEPDNYEIIYNIGCCLHAEGNHEESNKYFQKFLSLIKKDNRVYLPTKNLYIADCLMTMASAAEDKADEYKLHESAWNAFKQSKLGEQQESDQLQLEKLLNFLLRWAGLLEQKLMKIADKKSQEYLISKEAILDTYMELLQIESCPDRDAILNNCAVLFYQEKLYVNALANLSQVQNPNSITLNILALTYFHLGQHIMASNTIMQAAARQPHDLLIQFNRQIIEWVYGVQKEGRINKVLDNNDENLVIARWQYGIILIDAFSQSLRQTQKSDEDLPNLINKVLDAKIAQTFLGEIDKIKFRYLDSLFRDKTATTKGDKIPQRIVSLCLQVSTNVQKDLKQILQFFQNSRQVHEGLVQSLLSVYVLINREKSNSIRTILAQYCSKRTQTIQLQLDRKVSITSQERKKELQYQTIDDVINNLCTWQCELESKVVTLMDIIQKTYYHSKFRYPLQIEYNFPRHDQFDICSSTLNRLISLVYGTLKADKKALQLQQTNISSMKSEIIDKLLSDFETNMESSSFKATISLNQKVTIATVYANFQTKDQCIKFVKELQKQSSNKSLQFNQNNQQLQLVICDVLLMICAWKEKNSLMTAARSILRSPLEIYVQSIIQIDPAMDIINQSSEKAQELLSKLAEFKE